MKLSIARVLAAALVVASGTAFAAEARKPAKAPSPAVRYLNPEGLSAPRGYSHVVEVQRGSIVFIAGQVAQDASGKVIGVSDFRAQANQVFENLRIALQAVGADFTDVVKVNTYLLDMAQLPVLREVRDKYYAGVPHRPASTAVQVQKLAQDQFLLEIEAVAVLPEK